MMSLNLKEIKSLHKAENKELEKDMKSSELDKNYAWYLENKENKAIKDVLETKKNTFLSEWSKEIGNLESDEKLAYLKGLDYKYEYEISWDLFESDKYSDDPDEWKNFEYVKHNIQIGKALEKGIRYRRFKR